MQGRILGALTCVALLVGMMAFATEARAESIAETITSLDTSPGTLLWSGSKSATGSTWDFTLTNDTDVTWTDFHMGILSSSTQGNSFDDETYVGPGTETIASNGRSLDIDGISIADGSDLEFSITVYGAGVGEFFGTGMAVYAYPTTSSSNGGPAVPEPTSLALFGLGAAGLALHRRRRRTG